MNKKLLCCYCWWWISAHGSNVGSMQTVNMLSYNTSGAQLGLLLVNNWVSRCLVRLWLGQLLKAPFFFCSKLGRTQPANHLLGSNLRLGGEAYPTRTSKVTWSLWGYASTSTSNHWLVWHKYTYPRRNICQLVLHLFWKLQCVQLFVRWVIYIYICFINTILQMYISQPLPKVVPLLICILTEELSLERSSETGMVLDPPKEIPRWKTTLKAQEAHNRLKSWLFFQQYLHKFLVTLAKRIEFVELPRQCRANPLRGNFIFSCRWWWLTTDQVLVV